jgi:hypothetical protein
MTQDVAVSFLQAIFARDGWRRGPGHDGVGHRGICAIPFEAMGAKGARTLR